MKQKEKSGRVEVEVEIMGIPVELHEDEVPELEQVGVAGVDERRADGRGPVRHAVVVDLTAGTTRPSVCHRPKVGAHSKWKDSLLRKATPYI